LTAFLNPLAYKRISEMKMASGTTIDIDLNKFFKSIGSSVLPAYPGFRVMNTAQLKFSVILLSSK
jgi:hypothetical protein